MIDFTLQLAVRAMFEDEASRRVIRRYDCAHGYVHCDVYNRHGEQIAKLPMNASNLIIAAARAQEDFRRNAMLYLTLFRRS